jgi:hypothetical protein
MPLDEKCLSGHRSQNWRLMHRSGRSFLLLMKA